MEFSFAQPLFLLLLLLLPIFFFRGKIFKPATIKYPAVSYLSLKKFSGKSHSRLWLNLLRTLAFALCVIALAGPRLEKKITEIEASGIDILLGIDVSTSMEALDFTIGGQRTNRLEVVKNVVSKFIKQRPNDRIGILAFAGRPYLVSPLTLDHDWLEERLRSLETGIVEDGTAIGSAIASGTNRLRDQKAKSRILILLTDGMNNAGHVKPLLAAEAAEALKIKIYTIGVGSHGLVPFPARNAWGRMTTVMGQANIDETTLKKIAQNTGAKYFRSTDTNSLEKIYAEINKLEKSTRKIKKYSDFTNLFKYFAIPALALLLLEITLTNTIMRRLP